MELRKSIVYFAIVLSCLFFGFLLLTVRETVVFGFPVSVPVFGAPSFAMKLFLFSKTFLVPEGVPIVALGPMSSFVAPIIMAFLVATLLSFPVGLYLIVRFLRPALRPRERKTLLRYIAPSIFLFYLGCAFAYFFIIPKTFSILYGFAPPLEVVTFFALDDFIASVFFLTIAIGFSFLFPVVMVTASRIGLIPREFWLLHWRGAVASVIIFSAIITPDGSGVTMILLSVPFMLLYGLGTVISLKR